MQMRSDRYPAIMHGKVELISEYGVESTESKMADSKLDYGTEIQIHGIQN